MAPFEEAVASPAPADNTSAQGGLPRQSSGRPVVVADVPRSPAQVVGDEKDTKRRQRLDEVKTEMHSRLLDNLNLAALESAKENELRAEITAIVSGCS